MTTTNECPDLCRGGGMTPAKMRKASDQELEAHRKAMMAAAVADGRGMTRKGWNTFHAIYDELKRRGV